MIRVNATAVIPARYRSERLPGKPLRMIAGQSLIERVYRAVQSSELFRRVLVATEDSRIREAVESFGGEVVMTSESCSSGTERILEIREKLDSDLVLNVQGDEPFINRVALESLFRAFSDEQVMIASLMKKSVDFEQMKKPSVVKVVVDSQGDALYFSRSLIPYHRDLTKEMSGGYNAHIGVYGFRREVLDKLAELKSSPLEEAEKLEQLRWLENGLRIRMAETEYNGFGVDTEEDLREAERMLRKKV